jgi:hypothetical protein
MTMKVAALAIIATVAGCASYDLRVDDELRPEGADRYTWRTIADAAYPIDSANAERKRLDQLAVVMRIQGGCEGYTVTSRAATKQSNGLLGDVYDVFYGVQC